MDTLQEYILMCRKAKEIQELLPTERNQYFISCLDETKGEEVYGRFDGDYVEGLYSDDVRFMTQFKGSFIWLPRQDQLQRIISYQHNFSYALNLAEWIRSFKLNEYPGIANFSMEQLWLGFVMWEKFGKLFNFEKGEWIEYK